MKRMTMALLATLMLIGTTVALADNHAKAPNVGSVWILTPKADASPAAFEEAMRTHMAWRKENGDPRNWQTYVVAAGDGMNKYFVRACCFNWADQDTYDRWAYDKGATAAYAEHLGGMVKDVSRRFQVIDTENSNWDEEKGPYYYIGVTEWTPNPAKGMQMQPTVAEMSTLAKEKGWNQNWAWYSTIGQEANLMLASPFRAFSDMEPPEVSFFEFASAHMGEDAAAEMFQRFSESSWTSSYMIFRWREDLSMKND